MVLGLKKDGLISRQPGMPRSIRPLLERKQLPELRPANEQPVRYTMQGTSAHQFGQAKSVVGIGLVQLHRVRRRGVVCVEADYGQPESPQVAVVPCEH
jgi:hypothetical protein